jgi:hypothetical protein
LELCLQYHCLGVTILDARLSSVLIGTISSESLKDLCLQQHRLAVIDNEGFVVAIEGAHNRRHFSPWVVQRDLAGSFDMNGIFYS